jgi:hypothetical protein
MTYKLFIDDERFPVDDSWVIVRTSEEAIQHVKENGMPIYISFDHDLGGDDTSVKFIWWMIDLFLDGNIEISKDFDFYVHSQNPIGAENIRKLMQGFLMHYCKEIS